MALVLGVVQGVTEFLPISSDGHLALVYLAFSRKPDLGFEVFLHFATLLAMIVYFRADILDVLAAVFSRSPEKAPQRRLAVVIAIGTVVSGVVALGLKDVVEPLSGNLAAVGAFFLVTSVALAAAESRLYVSRRREHEPLHAPEDIPWWKAALIGLAQGAAVLPAVSRSGTTISGGILAGLDREQATRFSFLLGIPIIAAASALDAVDLVKGTERLPGLLPSALGFVAAAVAGYLAIAGLLTLVKRHSLVPFAVYTAVIGTATLVLAYLR